MAWHDRYSYGVNVQVTFEGEHGRPSLWMVRARARRAGVRRGRIVGSRGAGETGPGKHRRARNAF